MESTKLLWAVALWMVLSTAAFAGDEVNPAREDPAIAGPPAAHASEATANGSLDLATFETPTEQNAPEAAIDSPPAEQQPTSENENTPSEAIRAATVRERASAISLPSSIDTATPDRTTVESDRAVAEEDISPAVEDGPPAESRAIPRDPSSAGEQTSRVPPASSRLQGVVRHTAATGLPWYRSPYLVLFAVLLLIGGLTVLARRYIPAARPLATQAAKVVGRVAISGKQSVVLLHVGKRLVVVGVTPDSMRTLTEITDAEEVSFLLGQMSGATRKAGDEFQARLATQVSRYEPPAAEPVTPMAREQQGRSLHETKGQLQTLLGKLRALQSS